MTVQELKEQGCVIFECISGSQAYGLATPQSDVDIKGVFVLPKEKFYSLDYIDQVNENNNNVAYFELKKFIDLLSKNNPNMLEMVNMPADCILYKHPLFDSIKASYFLSKLCKDSFAGYAMTQLKKARGLNKKILNPMSGEKKSILDFCYVVQGQGSVPVKDFLLKNNMQQQDCGLVAIAHMREVFGLYHKKNAYRGIVNDERSLDVCLSPVEEGEKPVATLSFNKDGYSKYCKDYKEYFNWVNNRNEVRYENTAEHGKNYDAKNMMHTFRLLDMAEEIGGRGEINVRRPNREFLLRIKKGDFNYDELVQQAEEKLQAVNRAYENSFLPPAPDLEKINRLLVEMRDRFYKI
jgi:uncharacterized protein